MDFSNFFLFLILCGVVLPQMADVAIRLPLVWILVHFVQNWSRHNTTDLKIGQSAG